MGMNILQIIIIVIGTFTIFGFPIWNLARLRGSRNPLWLITPPIIFIVLFWVSRTVESYAYLDLYVVIKNIAFFWLIAGFVLFAGTVFGLIAEFLFKTKKQIPLYIIISFTVLYMGIASINGQRVVIKDLELPAENISREYNFAHITDLHSGSTTRGHAENVVEKINSINPEFVVITGDFIDEFYVEPEDIDPFNEIKVPIYLITGNHEYYVPTGTLERVIENSNIQLIDGQKVPYEEIDIYGVGELQSIDTSLAPHNGISSERYSIILDHQPKEHEAIRASENGAELMLSGHTHKGQVWPFSLLVQLQFKYVAGLYEIGDMFLYVNQGTGTLGPKIRLGTVNEVTNITLKPMQ